MKIKLLFVTMLTAFTTHGQGTLIYDQQSGDENHLGETFATIQGNEPIGQSFIPSLSSVAFVSLYLKDGSSGNNLGATVYVNLWSGSIGGTLLGSTDPVSMPDGFIGSANFFFSDSISLVAGTTYYFDVTIQSGSDFWGISQFNLNYPNGMEYFKGSSWPNSDLWFREGVLSVPEPSPSWLVLLGSGIFLYARRIFHR